MAVNGSWFKIKCHCGEDFLSESLWIQHKIRHPACTANSKQNIKVTAIVKLRYVTVPGSQLKDVTMPTKHTKDVVSSKASAAQEVAYVKPGVPRTVFRCNCGAGFANVNDFRQHTKTFHPEKKRLLDSDVHNTVQKTNNRVQNLPKKKVTFVCSCGKHFGDMKEFQLHQSTDHSKAKSKEA